MPESPEIASSSRAPLRRLIVLVVALLFAVVAVGGGIFVYQNVRAQREAEAVRLRAEQVADDQRQRAQETLSGAVGSANELAGELYPWRVFCPSSWPTAGSM